MPQESKKERILVVDDDPLILDSLKDLLEEAGYHVETASTAARAVYVLDHSPIDLLIVDYHLPDSNGLDVARHSRRQKPDRRVLLMSGQVTSEWVESQGATAISAFFPKPIDIRTLLGQVQAAFAPIPVPKRVADPKTLPTAKEIIAQLTSGKPHLLLIDDDSNITDALPDILQDTGYEVDTAGSVSEALERLERQAYCVLLIDYSLPDGNGVELAKEVREKCPLTRMILMSGHTGIERYSTDYSSLFSAFLAKPTELETLRSALQQVLADLRQDLRLASAQSARARENASSSFSLFEYQPPRGRRRFFRRHPLVSRIGVEVGILAALAGAGYLILPRLRIPFGVELKVAPVVGSPASAAMEPSLPADASLRRWDHLDHLFLKGNCGDFIDEWRKNPALAEGPTGRSQVLHFMLAHCYHLLGDPKQETEQRLQLLIFAGEPREETKAKKSHPKPAPEPIVHKPTPVKEKPPAPPAPATEAPPTVNPIVHAPAPTSTAPDTPPPASAPAQ